jgi:hypothetical protein
MRAGRIVVLSWFPQLNTYALGLSLCCEGSEKNEEMPAKRGFESRLPCKKPKARSISEWIAVIVRDHTRIPKNNLSSVF